MTKLPQAPAPWMDSLTVLDNEMAALETNQQSGPELYFNFVYLLNRINLLLEIAQRSRADKAQLKLAIAQCRRVLSTSPYLKRIQEWPRGYQGDFETIEHMNRGVVDYRFNDLQACIEYYAQTLPITQQHRNKLAWQERLARHAILNNHNILSVGCGGALDIHSALTGMEQYKGSITFIDMDADALHLVRTRTSNYDFKISNKNIVRGVGREENGFYHLILCGGLFDYLDDKVAGLLIRQLEKKLTPDGQLFLTNIAQGNPFRTQMEYMCDWELIERTEAQIDTLARSNIDTPVDVSSHRESTGLAILSTISRAAS